MKLFSAVAAVGLAAAGVWIAYHEKDPHDAAMIGYFAGLWAHAYIKHGSHIENI